MGTNKTIRGMTDAQIAIRATWSLSSLMNYAEPASYEVQIVGKFIVYKFLDGSRLVIHDGEFIAI